MKRIIILIGIIIVSINLCSAQLKVDANGNVGVGITTPISKFDVNGWMVLYPHNTATGEGGHMWLLGCTGYNSWAVDVGSDLFRIYSASGFNQAGITRLAINGSGNVGIGMTNPLYKLDVDGNARTGILRLSAENTQYEGGQIYFDSSSTTYKSWCVDVYQNRFRIYNPGAEKFTIIDNGNVGIGTATPNDRLEVNGNIRWSWGSQLRDQYYDGNRKGIILQQGYDGTNSNYVKYSAGGAGVSNSSYIMVSDAKPMQFITKDTTRMIIDYNGGNVGIGTATPAQNAKLAINDGHLQSIQTTLPTVSSPLVASVVSGSTDTKGKITTIGTINTNNTSSVTVTFNKTYTTAPVVVITAVNESCARLDCYVSSTTSQFVVTLKNNTGSNQTAPQFNYMVME